MIIKVCKKIYETFDNKYLLIIKANQITKHYMNFLVSLKNNNLIYLKNNKDNVLPLLLKFFINHLIKKNKMIREVN